MDSSLPRESFHYDPSRHSWVDRAVVNVRTGLREREREMVIRIERFRFEQFVIACHDVRDVVLIRPRDCRPRGNGQIRGAKAKIVDLYRGAGCGFVTGAYGGNRLDSTR